MSILSYKPVIFSGNIDPVLHAIIVPNGNTQPPVPPIPPSPNISTGGSGCCNEVVYEIINGRLLDNATLLNGTYVSKNQNQPPVNTTSQNILNLPRYSSGVQSSLSVNDSKLSIVDNLYIFFWIYPLYSVNMVKPITICTKGNQISSGEYTCQIGTDRRLIYSFTLANGSTTVIKSVQQIPEKVLTFVSIIKTTPAVYIYLNGRLDSQQSISINPAPTNNPLIIGSGYNTSGLDGYMDNFMITNTPTTWGNLISNYYGYVPSSYLYQFTNGKISFNGYNYAQGSAVTQPTSVDNAKAICTQLENYTNGFTYDAVLGDYIYYASYDSMRTTGLLSPTIYNKVGVLLINNNIFTRLRILGETLINTELGNPIQLNGYIQAYTGETFFFINGEAYEYDTVSKVYTLVQMNTNKASYLLYAINQNIAYKIISGRYVFYGYADSYTSNGGTQPNTVVKKLLRYTLGGINTLVDYSGVSEAGTWTYYSDIKYLNIGSQPLTRSLEDYRPEQPATKDIVVAPASSQVALRGDLPLITSGGSTNELANILYIYDANGMNLFSVMNRCSEFYLSSLPRLFGKYSVDVGLDTEFDIIDNILRNQIPSGKFIVMDLELNIAPGIYDISIVSNSLMKLSIGFREYTINTNNPQHIIFHKGRKPLELQFLLEWQRISQIAKFIIIEA